MKITYIHHSSFLVELESVYLLFDYTEGTIPGMKREKPLLVLASHRHGDHYSPVIFDLIKEHGNVRFVLSNDIWRKRLPEEVLPLTDSLKHGETVKYRLENGIIRQLTRTPENQIEDGVISDACLTIHTYKSTDEGVAFLIEAEGKTIYHAGDLNNWRWEGEPDNWNDSMAKKYSAQIDKMAGMHLDVAFLPLDPRQEDDFYLGMDEFLHKVDVKHVFPMHCWGDYSVIGKIRALGCSAGYSDRIVEITGDGEVFTEEDERFV